MPQIASDNFQRSGPSLGPNWSFQGDFDPEIQSPGIVIPVSQFVLKLAYWNANTFQPDQYSEITIGTLDRTTTQVGPGVRWSPNPSAQGYQLLLSGPADGSTNCSVLLQVW